MNTVPSSPMLYSTMLFAACSRRSVAFSSVRSSPVKKPSKTPALKFSSAKRPSMCTCDARLLKHLTFPIKRTRADFLASVVEPAVSQLAVAQPRRRSAVSRAPPAHLLLAHFARGRSAADELHHRLVQNRAQRSVPCRLMPPNA